MAIVVNDLGESEDVEVVKEGGGNESRVKRCERVAVVVEGLVSEGWDRKTVLRVSRHHECEEELEEKVARVDFPSIGIGTRILSRRIRKDVERKGQVTYLGNVTPHPRKERLDVLGRVRINKLAIVEPEANPEIIHEDREASHDGDDTPWPTELVPVRGVVNDASENRVPLDTHDWCCSSFLSISRPCSVT